MRNVLITGAAAGIGRATAQRFLAGGWRVGAYDVDVTGLGDLAERHSGDPLVTGALDVRDPDGWRGALEEFCGDDALDLLANNAGILQIGPFVENDLDAQLATIDVNVKGVLAGCHTAYPWLRRSREPQVINLASASAIYGQRDLATYSASKFAVRGLSEALDLEWSGDGIRVQAMWPLFVKTAMTEHMDIGTSRALGINLEPQQVAEQIWKAAHRPRMLHRLSSIRRPVGRDTTASMLASSVTPSWVLRKVNGFLGTR